MREGAHVMHRQNKIQNNNGSLCAIEMESLYYSKNKRKNKRHLVLLCEFSVKLHTKIKSRIIYIEYNYEFNKNIPIKIKNKSIYYFQFELHINSSFLSWKCPLLITAEEKVWKSSSWKTEWILKSKQLTHDFVGNKLIKILLL